MLNTLKSKQFTFTLLLCVLAGIYYCYAHVSDQKRYEIVNEIERDNNLGLDKICASYNKFETFENDLNSFSFIDRVSVYLQKTIHHGGSIEPNKIKYYSRRTKSFQYAEIIKNCDQEHHIIYKISYPIISVDQKTVMITITQDCNCLLGGQGGTYVFKKINNRWKLTGSYNGWIS